MFFLRTPVLVQFQITSSTVSAVINKVINLVYLRVSQKRSYWRLNAGDEMDLTTNFQRIPGGFILVAAKQKLMFQ
jgi:hypothetical protein